MISYTMFRHTFIDEFKNKVICRLKYNRCCLPRHMHWHYSRINLSKPLFSLKIWNIRQNKAKWERGYKVWWFILVKHHEVTKKHEHIFIQIKVMRNKNWSRKSMKLLQWFKSIVTLSYLSYLLYYRDWFLHN